MKTKLILLAVVAIALLSFTFSTSTGKQGKSSSAVSQTDNAGQSGGLAMEDRDQWK